LENKKPLVSVITVTFNLVKNGRCDYIKQCIESVKKQSYENIEHIIIDGASNDGTLQLLSIYEFMGWIKVFSERDSGIYDAMNKGIDKSSGKYIAFLNSDDYWFCEKGVELSVNALEENNADFSFAPVYYLNSNEEMMGVLEPSIGNFFLRMPFSHQSMFVKREILLKEQGFNTKYNSSADYDLVLRLCFKGYKFVQVKKNFTFYRWIGFSAVNASNIGEEECINSMFNCFSMFIELKKEDIIKMFYEYKYPIYLYRAIHDILPLEYQIELEKTKPIMIENEMCLSKNYHFIDENKSIRLLFDATILYDYYLGYSFRTSVFFVTLNVLNELANSKEIVVYLYCLPYAKDNVRRLIDEGVLNNNIKFYYGNKVNIFLSPFYSIPEQVRSSGILCYSILYDTIPLIFPNLFDSNALSIYSNMIKSYTKNDYFFSISNNTKKDFEKYAENIDPEKIIITPLAASEKFYPVNDIAKIVKVKNKYKIPANKNYIFSLCSKEEQKNVIYTLDSYIRFIEKNNITNIILVFGGLKWQSFESELDNRILCFANYSENIIFTGYIEDDELASLYSGSFCFAYPSLYEGFSIPPLEAMKCGCPVITSNNSSLPEVVGECGIMIDIYDEFAMSNALSKMYFDEDFRQKLKISAIKRSSEFSWKKTVEIMIDSFYNNPAKIIKQIQFIEKSYIDLQHEIIVKQNEIINRKNEINTIYSSETWKIVRFISKVRNKLMPKDSCIRKILNNIVK